VRTEPILLACVLPPASLALRRAHSRNPTGADLQAAGLTDEDAIYQVIYSGKVCERERQRERERERAFFVEGSWRWPVELASLEHRWER